MQFNKSIFEYEQQEYAKEGIRWDVIQFQNNQSNIDVMEKFIFSRLDDECITSRGITINEMILNNNESNQNNNL